MGARNVKAAYDHWRNLPDSALRLLVFMALVAKDDDDPPKFWAGRETLARHGMGWRLPDDAIERKAVWRRLARVVEKLTSRGAIEVERAGAPGRHTTYRLNLSGCHSATSVDSPDGCHPVTPVSGQRMSPGDPNRCRPATPTDVTQRHPEEEEGSCEEKLRASERLPHLGGPDADARSDDEQPPNSTLHRVTSSAEFIWKCLACDRVVGDGCPCPERRS